MSHTSGAMRNLSLNLHSKIQPEVREYDAKILGRLELGGWSTSSLSKPEKWEKSIRDLWRCGELKPTDTF